MTRKMISEIYPLNSLTVKSLLQQEADNYLKGAYAYEELRKGLAKAFQSELSDPLRKVWALSELGSEGEAGRFYFLVGSPAGPELLASINALHKHNISSFAKLVPRARSRARGRDCVRKFIEDVVVPECKASGCAVAAVVTTTKEGEVVMKELQRQKNLPRGVKKIERGSPLPAANCQEPVYPWALCLNPGEA